MTLYWTNSDTYYLFLTYFGTHFEPILTLILGKFWYLFETNIFTPILGWYWLLTNFDIHFWSILTLILDQYSQTFEPYLTDHIRRPFSSNFKKRFRPILITILNPFCWFNTFVHSNRPVSTPIFDTPLFTSVLDLFRHLFCDLLFWANFGTLFDLMRLQLQRHWIDRVYQKMGKDSRCAKFKSTNQIVRSTNVFFQKPILYD